MLRDAAPFACDISEKGLEVFPTLADVAAPFADHAFENPVSVVTGFQFAPLQLQALASCLVSCFVSCRILHRSPSDRNYSDLLLLGAF
jgi:hypothetical protein